MPTSFHRCVWINVRLLINTSIIATEDFKKERQSCVHQAIQRNGGNMENAMKECQSGSDYSVDLANWAGSRFGSKAGKNKLIDSSAKWAGFTSSEAQRSVGLLQALVGDTVVGKGKFLLNMAPEERPSLPERGFMKSKKIPMKKISVRVY